jgi:hypothetical protein
VRARFTSAAEMELKEAMESYEAAQEGLGAKFLAEVWADPSAGMDAPLSADAPHSHSPLSVRSFLPGPP